MTTTEHASVIRKFQDLLVAGEVPPADQWQVQVISSSDCQSYIALNAQTCEAILIDPKLEDMNCYEQAKADLSGYLWLAVVDTHTHADHVSAAASCAELLQAPLVMHAQSPSQRVQLRASKNTFIPSHAGPIHLFVTPGHTPDGICVLWGPFLFTGDTVLYGDVGRDDLPGGDASRHYDSVQLLIRSVSQTTLVFPGHDNKGGRVSSWATQLKVNSSLTQPREEFIRECAAFEGTPPALLKKSLFENFK